MANHFTQKPILKRIKMMQKKKMKWMNGMKLILFIPAFTLLLMAFGKTNVKLSPKESVVGQVDEKINYDQSQNDKLNLVIEIKKDGNYIDGTLMSIEEILNKAKSLQKEGREIVLLKIDGTLPHSRVDEVREALESVNIIHINQSYFGTEEIVYPIGDVSIHPKFKQGNWNDWVNNQLKDLLMGKPNYGPATLVYGFIIDYNGKVRDAHIITASDIPEINAAYEKVLAQAPDWQPARKGNKNVSVFHKIRIGSKVVQVLRIDLKHDDKELDLERIKKEAEVKFKSTNGECSSVIYAEEGVSEDDIKAVKEVLKKAGIKIITVTNNIPPSPVNLKLSRENEVFIGEYIYPKTGNVTKVIAWSKKVNLEELQEYLIKQKDLVEKENKKNGTKYDLVVNVNVEVGVTDKQNSTLKEVLRKTKIQHLNYSSEIQEEDWKSKK